MDTLPRPACSRGRLASRRLHTRRRLLGRRATSHRWIIPRRWVASGWFLIGDDAWRL